MNGISKSDLKRQNRKQLLRILQTEGPTSRVDLAGKIGITKAAVTVITNEMIDQGILFEKGEQPVKGAKVSRGRKKILLDIEATCKMGMGLVIDRGYIHLGLATLRGGVVEKHIVPISAEDNAEDIIATIENLYKDIVYKNDLKSDSVVGIGVSIAREYYSMFGITEEEGTSFSKIKERLAVFMREPLVFGSIMEGIVTVWLDSPSESKRSNNVVALRFTGGFDSAICIENRIYKGTRGRGMDLSEYKVQLWSRNDYIKKIFTWESVGNHFKEIFSAEETPIIWNESGSNFQNACELLRKNDYTPQDQALIEMLDDIARGYLKLISDIRVFLDPDTVILFGEQEKGSAIDEYILKKVLGAFNTDEEKFVVKSIFDRSNVFLATTALAIREFFINKGGF